VLLEASNSVVGHLSGTEAEAGLKLSHDVAEAQGRTLYDQLLGEHRERNEEGRAKGEYSFSARRRAIERIGLPEVRAHRLTELEQEEAAWRKIIEVSAEAMPEMTPLLLVRV
jgi:hypothetical protein